MAGLAGGVEQLYFGGDLEAGVALTGQVAGRIDGVKLVSEIIADTVREYVAAVEGLVAGLTAAAGQYPQAWTTTSKSPTRP